MTDKRRTRSSTGGLENSGSTLTPFQRELLLVSVIPLGGFVCLALAAVWTVADGSAWSFAALGGGIAGGLALFAALFRPMTGAGLAFPSRAEIAARRRSNQAVGQRAAGVAVPISLIVLFFFQQEGKVALLAVGAGFLVPAGLRFLYFGLRNCAEVERLLD
jgi:dipeptide/tripeptide permease